MFHRKIVKQKIHPVLIHKHLIGSPSLLSGVATLSPSTSDSAELASPYSPSDSSSEPSSDAGSCISTGSRNSVVASSPGRPPVHFASTSSSSSSSSSSTDTDTDSESAGQQDSGAGRMTALSAVLESSPPPQPQKIVTGQGVGVSGGGAPNGVVANGGAKVPVTNFISFQIPKSQSAHAAFQNPVKIVESGQAGGKSVSASTPFHCDVSNYSKASKNITNIFATLKYPAGGSSGSNGGATPNIPDLTQTDYQPIVKVPNLRGTKSFILHGEGQLNKVIILSVPKTSLSISSNNNNNNSKGKGTLSQQPATNKAGIPPNAPANGNHTTLNTHSNNLNPTLSKALSNSPNINNNSSKMTNNNLHVNKVSNNPSTTPHTTNTNASGNNNDSVCNGGANGRTNAIKSVLSCDDTSPARKKARLDSSDIIPVKISLATSELLDSKPQSLTIPIHKSKSSTSPLVQTGPKKTDHPIEVTKTNKPSLDVITKKSNGTTHSNHHNSVHPSTNTKKTLSLSLQIPISMSPSLSRSVSPTKISKILMSPTASPSLNHPDGGPTGAKKKKLHSNDTDSAACAHHKAPHETPKSSPVRKRKGDEVSPPSGSVAGNPSNPSLTNRTMNDMSESTNKSASGAVQYSRVPSTLTTTPASTPPLSVSSSSFGAPAESATSCRSPLTSSAFPVATALTSIRTTTASLSNSGLVDSNISDQPLAKSSANAKSTAADTPCMWKDCNAHDANLNILEHIQTTHVAPQVKTDGYMCLWEGCKVFSKKSSSLSWLERHVLSHSGNKPFKCIFPGCGLSFSSQGTLERHVNSHISTNGSINATNGNSSLANRKVDSSPVKSVRRKKKVFRKQRLNTGQFVDFFDKRTMEVIKHKLASVVALEARSPHDCTFRGEVLARRTCSNEEPSLLVHWHPELIFSDEWIAQSKFRPTKSVPLRQIPSDKIKLLYPQMFPPERRGKAQRKWKPSSGSSSCSTSSSLPSSAASSPLTMSLCSVKGDSSSSSSSTSSLLSLSSSTSSAYFSSRRAAVDEDQQLEDDDNDDESSECCNSSCGCPNVSTKEKSLKPDWAILFLEGELQS